MDMVASCCPGSHKVASGRRGLGEEGNPRQPDPRTRFHGTAPGQPRSNPEGCGCEGRAKRRVELNGNADYGVWQSAERGVRNAERKTSVSSGLSLRVPNSALRASKI